MNEPMTRERLEEIRSKHRGRCTHWYRNLPCEKCELLAELDLRNGEIAANGERLKLAAERVWGEHKWGCDTPDALADLVLSLKTQRLGYERRVALVAQIAAKYSVADIEGALRNDKKAVAWALDLVEAAEEAIVSRAE